MGALDGYRVLDLGLLVQGPQAGSLLSDMGADVIKVELPGMGDQARWIPLALDDLRFPYFVACNRGKRSVTFDLRTEGGKQAFLDLADTADVMISNFSGGTLDEWGIGFDVVAERNPRIVYATGTVFGADGPESHREGADILGQASGGIISTTGLDTHEPTPIGATVADHIGSQNMANGVLAALLARERTGKGQRVDVSLMGGQIYAQASEYTAFFLNGKVPGRANWGHPLLHAAYGVFPTADGHIAIAGVPPATRHAFYDALELPELAEEERFAPLLYDAETKAALFEKLIPQFRTRTTAEWEERLVAAGQRVAPVRDYAAVADDPMAWENGYFQRFEHPEWGEMNVVGSPIKMSDTPLDSTRPLPELGQHTEEVLLEIGYTWEQIAELSAGGAT